MAQPTRVLLVDDHPIVRCGLRELISGRQDVVVCGEAADAGEALEALEAFRPDLLIVDISLKGESGIELIKRLKARDRNVKIVVCSMHDELYFAERSLHAGALGYVNKQEATDKLLEAVLTVREGKVYLTSRMTERLLYRAIGSLGPVEDPMHRLSDREVEILELIGQALTTSEIAEKLCISPKTVETHRENIKAKLNLKNSAELTRWAVQWVLEKA